MVPGSVIKAERRRSASAVMLALVVAGMWSTELQPVPARDRGAHECSSTGIAVTQGIALASAQDGCHDMDVVCLIAAGCVTGISALSLPQTTIHDLSFSGRGYGRPVTPLVDLFQTRPPTPPPNS